VAFMPVWDYSEAAKNAAAEDGCDLFEYEPDVVSGIEGYILEVSPKTVIDMDGAPVVKCGAFAVSAIPEVNPEEGAKIEYGDTHDFRSRTFDTQEEAERFLDYTVQRFKHPHPWESFVQL